MAADPKLVKSWIQFLKNNQIVALKSDPEGKLQYKRKVTAADLTRFLEVKTHYSPDAVSNAIKMVLSKKGGAPRLANNPTPEEPPKPGTDVSTWMYSGMRPGDPRNRLQAPNGEEPKQVQGKPSSKISYDPDSVSDIDYKDVPPENDKPGQLGWNRKPRFKYRNKGLKEDFNDSPEPELDENDVEAVLSLLASGGEIASPGAAAVAAGKESDRAERASRKKPPPSPEETKAKQEDDMRRVKQLIRDVMTPNQRKALWRALNET